MKKIILLILLHPLAFLAQNSFPQNGNVKIKNTNSFLHIEGTGSGNFNGGFLYLTSKSISPGNTHASTLLGNHKSTDGTSTFEIQRRGLQNEYNGTLAEYKDGKGWVFSIASNKTSGGVFNAFKINSLGNVGIGTVNPDSKLTVKGDIHCEEVLVDLEVPADYVFQKYYTGSSSLKEDYTMPTLEEIETFTKENHHLPNVPSAKKIQEGGLQLKEMTNLLLQKIEELTLYTIEQEKRIKALEAQVQATKKKK